MGVSRFGAGMFLRLLRTQNVRALWLACFLSVGNPVASAQALSLAAADSVPTAYIENGKPAGLLVDIVVEAFKRAGYPVDILVMPWARCQAEVKAGKIDGIFSVYRTPERLEFLTYADEVLIVQVQAFFVRKDSAITFDGDFDPLSALPIGIINQTSYGARLDAALTKGIFKNVDLANNASSNIQKLLHGRVDIVPSYRHVVLYSAKTLGVADAIKELSPAIDSIPSYLAFSNKRDYKTVIGEYNKALQSMKKDGTYEAIFNKYLGTLVVGKAGPVKR